MTHEEIGILILAAGDSSRMGIPKQMLPIDGTSLLGRTISTALETKLQHVAVVLGSNADEHRIAANEFPVTTIMNPAWQQGISTSIKIGVKHFQEIKSVKSIIILVCDQPTLTAAILLQLIDKQKHTRKPIIASRYADTIGVPALFTDSIFEKLLTLEGDQGAKKIILQHQELVSTIDFSSGEIDLDTPEDYDNFIKKHNP